MDVNKVSQDYNDILAKAVQWNRQIWTLESMIFEILITVNSQIARYRVERMHQKVLIHGFHV